MNAKVVNLVATADLKQPVDLDYLSKFPFIIYDQEIYGGRVAYLKTRKMFGKVSIFFSGKLISIGTKSREQALHDLKYTHNILVSNQIINHIKLKIIVHNIVAILDTQLKMDLEDLSSSNENAIYEPTQFPAVFLHIEEPKSVFTIFNSGKTIITGVKSLKELDDAVEKILKIFGKIS